jgi:hypothetical protein
MVTWHAKHVDEVAEWASGAQHTCVFDGTASSGCKCCDCGHVLPADYTCPVGKHLLRVAASRSVYCMSTRHTALADGRHSAEALREGGEVWADLEDLEGLHGAHADSGGHGEGSGGHEEGSGGHEEDSGGGGVVVHVHPESVATHRPHRASDALHDGAEHAGADHSEGDHAQERYDAAHAQFYGHGHQAGAGAGAGAEGGQAERHTHHFQAAAEHEAAGAAAEAAAQAAAEAAAEEEAQAQAQAGEAGEAGEAGGAETHFVESVLGGSDGHGSEVAAHEHEDDAPHSHQLAPGGAPHSHEEGGEMLTEGEEEGGEEGSGHAGGGGGFTLGGSDASGAGEVAAHEHEDDAPHSHHGHEVTSEAGEGAVATGAV